MSEPLLEAIQREKDVVLILDGERRIRFVNGAWTVHAHRDGAAWLGPERVVGTRYLDWVTGALAPIVENALESAFAPEVDVQGVWLHGECNTPTEYRTLSTNFAPLRVPNAYEGVLVVRHALRAMGPIGERYSVRATSVDRYRETPGSTNATGIIRQCSCCRRVWHPQSREWHLVLDLFAHHAPDVSHGLCDTCVELYYGAE